jgi:hypothetical protein
MREIFFRGQTRRKGQKVWMDGSPVEGNWVYGGICHGTGDFSIIYGNLDEERERPTEKWAVYTDTVGQFTGLTDKNGKSIFEGDIVRILGDQSSADWRNVDYVALIAFIDGGFCALDGTVEDHGFRRYALARMDFDLEILGNIHDNPELLGGVEDG